MNEVTLKLYNELIGLMIANDAFYFKDQELDGVTYRVFSYRLASYSDFCLPSALECRGIMFRMDGRHPEKLVCRPMEKFFNLNENPFTMDLELKDFSQIMLKMDGSLISTFLHRGELRLKSKTSLTSDHAINAMKFLDTRPALKAELEWIIRNAGFTVNMEYTSPEPNMRIVIGYQEPQLTILNIRNNRTGEYIDKSELYLWCVDHEINKNWVARERPKISGQEFVESIPSMLDIEGYVIQLKSGQHIKIKTDWYRTLHHTKDSVNNPRRLFEAVLDEVTDDLREMFKDDPYAMKSIIDMEKKVSVIYNDLVKSVEDFYTNNRDMERKFYAIKGQAELDSRKFGMVMMKYLGKEIDYKQNMKKWYKEFGVDDAIDTSIIDNSEE